MLLNICWQILKDCYFYKAIILGENPLYRTNYPFSFNWFVIRVLNLLLQSFLIYLFNITSRFLWREKASRIAHNATGSSSMTIAECRFNWRQHTCQTARVYPEEWSVQVRATTAFYRLLNSAVWKWTFVVLLMGKM